jgi:L-aminopeptidase/D-esterase-like protein
MNRSSTSPGVARPRARDLGIPFDGRPAPFNAITDVAGVEVGLTTIIRGEDVRTGVTAILPRGKGSTDPAFAGWFALNGNGEMTGTAWIDEAGFLEGPILITNTHSVGVVRDAAIRWSARHDRLIQPWALPVVAETWDGTLNDINGFHVTADHVAASLDGATGGPVPEGNVGGGTGMICYGFKGGTGTASRRIAENGHTVGALVQANHGARHLLTVAGVPVGSNLAADPTHEIGGPATSKSIIIVLATDAPLLPHQLKRLARRASLGLARTGSISANSSGDIFIAFSTANAEAASRNPVAHVDMMSNDHITTVFEAAVQATEEAIINALIGAETMTGLNGTTVKAIEHDSLVRTMRKYGRIPDPA